MHRNLRKLNPPAFGVAGVHGDALEDAADGVIGRRVALKGSPDQEVQGRGRRLLELD